MSLQVSLSWNSYLYDLCLAQACSANDCCNPAALKYNWPSALQRHKCYRHHQGVVVLYSINMYKYIFILFRTDVYLLPIKDSLIFGWTFRVYEKLIALPWLASLVCWCLYNLSLLWCCVVLRCFNMLSRLATRCPGCFGCRQAFPSGSGFSETFVVAKKARMRCKSINHCDLRQASPLWRQASPAVRGPRSLQGVSYDIYEKKEVSGLSGRYCIF